MNSKEIFEYIKQLENENKEIKSLIVSIATTNKKRYNNATAPLIVVQEFESILEPGELPKLKEKFLKEVKSMIEQEEKIKTNGSNSSDSISIDNTK